MAVSSRELSTVDRLWASIADRIADMLPVTEGYLLQEEQHRTLAMAAMAVRDARSAVDPLIVADHLRRAATLLSQLLGVDQLDAMLNALFARFCVGK